MNTDPLNINDWPFHKKYVLEELTNLRRNHEEIVKKLETLTTKEEFKDFKDNTYSILEEIRDDCKSINKDIVKIRERVSKQEVKMGIIGSVAGTVGAFLISLFKP